VLLVSRIGLGAEGRGIRTWVLGDVALTLARIVAAATIAELPLARDLSFPVVTGGLAAIGLVAHAQAVRSVAGRPARPWLVAAQALGLSLLFVVPASQMASLTHRMRWFDGMILCAAALTLWWLRPLLRFWGARLIALMMTLALVFQGLRFGALLVGIDAELPPEAAYSLRTSVRPASLVVDLVIALFVTAGFVLLLQERLRERIERLVVTDALTGSLNRHGIMPMLDAAWAQAQRHGRPLSVVLFDLDHFKRVNDQHGHGVGDEVLAGFAARVGAQLRESDVLSRWGGEEFLLLLADTELAGAHRVAERLRQLVAGTPMAGSLRVTVSAGVASFVGGGSPSDPQTTRDLLELLDTADRRLYLAKRQRNCVVSSEDAESLAPDGARGAARAPGPPAPAEQPADHTA
jgi:diguanylate cyclase (GGDEF)-like protein